MKLKRDNALKFSSKSKIVHQPHSHGFVLVGSGTLFLCHLPVFHKEIHRYQLIMQVSLPEYQLLKYRQFRQHYSEDTFILGNMSIDPMTLLSLIEGVRKEFIGEMFRGFPEEISSKPVMKNIRVTIEKVVYARHFDATFDYPPYLTYIIFGAGDEAHLTHYISHFPDFHHITTLNTIPSWLPQPQLSTGVTVNFPTITGTSTKKITEAPFTKDHYMVQYCGLDDLYVIEPGKNIWFDIKHLNMRQSHEN